MPIVVVGNVFVDVKGFPDNQYIPAGRNSGWVEMVHGGVGRNVAEDLANIGLGIRFVSMVDDTAQGTEVMNRLKERGADTRYVIQEPDGMGMWLAVFDSCGDIAASISKRPVMDPMAKLLKEKGDEIFADADSVVVEIDMDQEIIQQVFHFAKKYNKPVFAVVANMSIATQRREFLQSIDCFVCNEQEAGILFVDDFSDLSPEELSEKLAEKVVNAQIPSMIVTLGGRGSVYASCKGEKGICPANKVTVRDTTGAGDAFCAGAAAGLTYGKTMQEAVRIGTTLAASVLSLSENVCPRFLPSELGISVKR